MSRTHFRILVIALVIALVGILSIYSCTYQKEDKIQRQLYQRQIFWLILGLFVYLIVSNFNYRRLWEATYFLYASMIFLLFLVFILGTMRLGAQRWLRFVGFNFQPAEIAKLISVIFLSRYFSVQLPDDISLAVNKFGLIRGLALPFFFIAFPIGFIFEQPDLGSATMLFFIFLGMLYFSNLGLRYIFIFLFFGILLLPILWQFLRDYQKQRLLVFLNPNIDPLGAGYTVIQSKIAIGSGGFLGKGWLGGSQGQLHFLPEAHTDFIFASFVEEWGLVGAGVLLFLYYLLIKEGLEISLRTNENFGRLLALGISSMLGIQIFINVAMTMGLAPVVGLPLPLMSYGGSSIIITFISLGILANIDKKRTVF